MSLPDTNSPNYIRGFQFEQKQRGMSRKEMVGYMAAASSAKSERLLDLSWLSASAAHYNVSANPDDYLFAPVRAVTADLPNRNGHCFNLEDLTSMNLASGCLTYKTFEGKPLLVNHEYVLPKACGIIVSAELVQDGPYVMVELIVGVDTTKNKRAASMFKAGECAFSMGAMADHFVCSVCATKFTGDKPCPHCRDQGLLRPHDHKGKKVLAYMIAKDFYYIEHSLLMDQPPADPRALHNNMSIVSK